MMIKAHPARVSSDSRCLSIDIALKDACWQPLCAALDGQARFVWHQLGLPSAELSLILADDDYVAQLNKTYRDKDGATNVLSFPAHDFAAPVTVDDFPAHDFAAPVMLGDIILAYATLQCEAAMADKSLETHARHLLTHGLLHLLGYDHITPRNAEIMEALESRLLLAGGQPDPYVSPDAPPDKLKEAD